MDDFSICTGECLKKDEIIKELVNGLLICKKQRNFDCVEELIEKYKNYIGDKK